MRYVGAGLISVDIIQGCGSDWAVRDDAPVYTGGGTVANILCHLGWAGCDCTIIGGVGDDELGPIVRQDLEGFGVRTSGLVERPGLLTRRIAHLVAVDGEQQGAHKFLTECYACGRDFPPFPVIQLAWVEGVIKPLFTSRTVLVLDRANELTAALARSNREAGGVNVFEPGYLSRNRDVVEEIVGLTDLLKYSTELKWGGEYFKDSPLALPKGDMLTIETRNKSGVRALRGNREVRLTTTPILEVVDTAGAGDAFMAGFLTGLGEAGIFDLGNVSDSELESALERAQALGGLACLFVGARGILMLNSRAEVEEAITSTIKERRPPVGFGSREVRGRRATPGSASACDVCRI